MCLFELYKLVKSCETCQAFPTSQVPCLSPFPCYPLTFVQYPTNVLHYMKVMKKISKIYTTLFSSNTEQLLIIQKNNNSSLISVPECPGGRITTRSTLPSPPSLSLSSESRQRSTSLLVKMGHCQVVYSFEGCTNDWGLVCLFGTEYNLRGISPSCCQTN